MKIQELNEEELTKVTGGNTDGSINYKFKIGDEVRCSNAYWELEITDYAGWDYNSNCPCYETKIIFLPSTYEGGWKLNETYYIDENSIYAKGSKKWIYPKIRDVG